MQRRITSPSGRTAALPQTGQWSGKRKAPNSGWPLVLHDLNDLGNHVAGPLDDDQIADPHILADDLVLVVQGGAADHHAADRHRLQLRDRSHGARPADLDRDRLQPRLRLLRRELVSDGPARSAADESKPLLPVQPVDLVDDAVDVEGQRRAPLLHLIVVAQQRLGPVAQFRRLIGPEAPLLQPLPDLPLGRTQRLRHLAPGIAEEPQRTPGGDPRIELPQAAGGGIARIGEDRLALLDPPLVQLHELGAVHIDLAPHFQHIRNSTGQFLRNIADGPHIGGDVLALLPIATGGGHDQLAMLVAERAGQPVDLGFGDELDRLAFLDVEEAADALDEFLDFLSGEGVAEREHGNRVPDLGEPGGRCGADLL